MQTLGFVMLTKDSATFVGRVLEQARSYADDIAVWVDVSSADGTADVCRKWADRVEIIDTQGYIEPHLQMMHDSMKTDFIVRLDDDEILGAGFWRRKALLTALPFNAIAFRRYNLVTDERHYAASLGFYPDWQVRMVRRGKARFPTRIHATPDVVDASLVMHPNLHVFHLKNLVRTQAELDVIAASYARRLGLEPTSYRMPDNIIIRECEEMIG